MTMGEHSHSGTHDYTKHIQDCSDMYAHKGYAEDYVHKHFAGCLEDDPNAVMDEEHAKGVRRFKFIMMFVFFCTCQTGLIPKLCSLGPGSKRSETALSLLNCFSAGIFLAMAILHLMPASVEIHAAWAKKNNVEEPFPLPYLCFLAGYCLVLFIDKVLSRACGLGGHSHDNLD